MNILEENPDKLHVLFRNFWATHFYLDTVFPSGSPYIFQMYIECITHYYRNCKHTYFAVSYYLFFSSAYPSFFLTSCIISYHPRFMFLSSKPLPHLFHRRPTLFSKDLFFFSFSGVIYVTPYPISISIKFAFGLALPLPSTFGLNTLCIFFSFFFFLSVTPSSNIYFNYRLHHPSPAQTYNLSFPCELSPRIS